MMHLLQMAKVAERSKFAEARFRMYCSCGRWYTGVVEQDTEEWTEAQEDFFEHLAELDDTTYPERILMEHDLEDSYGGTE